MTLELVFPNKLFIYHFYFQFIILMIWLLSKWKGEKFVLSFAWHWGDCRQLALEGGSQERTQKGKNRDFVTLQLTDFPKEALFPDVLAFSHQPSFYIENLFYH